jgi:hypothetical protein
MRSSFGWFCVGLIVSAIAAFFVWLTFILATNKVHISDFHGSVVELSRAAEANTAIAVFVILGVAGIAVGATMMAWEFVRAVKTGFTSLRQLILRRTPGDKLSDL